MHNIANLKPSKSVLEKQEKAGSIPLPVKLAFLESSQTSLDLHDTLDQVLKTINVLVRVDSLHYCSEDKSISVNIGRGKRSCVSYRIHHPQGSLGALNFSRTTPFDESELATIEAFIGLVVGPLRNAIMYREALTNSLRDTLTQLGNRTALDSTLKRELALAQRNHLPLSLIITDLDFFKNINDQYGHQVGDKAIVHAVQCFKSRIRKTDQIFRFGGEEFVIILPNSKNTSAMAIAERIRKTLNSTTFEHSGTEIPILASMGIASLQEHDSADSLFERADMALYCAKQSGRNCCKSGESGAVLKANDR